MPVTNVAAYLCPAQYVADPGVQPVNPDPGKQQYRIKDIVQLPGSVMKTLLLEKIDKPINEV